MSLGSNRELTGDVHRSVENVSATPSGNTAADLSRETNQIGMTGIKGGAERVALTTLHGVADTFDGLVHAAEDDLHHPAEILRTVGGSALVASALKFALPEAGPVGKIATYVMGAWYVGHALPAFGDAYRLGLKANTWKEMDSSGVEWGNTAGRIGVNSALGIVGYKLGARASGNLLARESMDGFADFKQGVWNNATDRVRGLLQLDTKIPTASSVGLQPNYVVEGDRAKLVDSQQAGPPSDSVIGPVQSDAELNATIMLRSKASVLRMDRYISRMAAGKASSLSDENNAFEEKFGATQESLDAVTTFANKYNLTVAEKDLRSGRVFVTGKASDFQNAFKVELKQYDTFDGTRQGHEGAVSLPVELMPHVRAVLGTDERPVATSSYRVMAEPEPEAGAGDKGAVDDVNFIKRGGYLATEIAKAQNFPLKSGGEGQHGAFVTFSGGVDLDPANPTNYNSFFPAHGLEQPKPLNVIGVGGAVNKLGMGDVENALDAVQLQSIAPKADINMLVGQNSDQGVSDVYVRGVFPEQGEPQITVISSSWGLGELKQTPQIINTVSITMRQAALRNVQVFAGAGDNGARSLSDFFQPEYPASDPNVVGVGGLKMILGADGKPKSVTAWDEGEHSSTGGGVSRLFKLPRFQWLSNVPSNIDTGKPGRGVPDISTNAAKSTGFPVRVGNEDVVIGGTSAGAPLYAGMMLNINSELASLGIKPVTPLNEWLYARANTNIFKDVATGGNHGYEAKKGWDPVTGLGWVDGQNMLDAMKENQTNRLPSAIILPFGATNEERKASLH